MSAEIRSRGSRGNIPGSGNDSRNLSANISRNDPHAKSSICFLASNEVKISFWIKSFIILFGTALYAGTYRNICSSEVTCETNTTSCFSSENTRVHLRRITSLGPRPAGSKANEISAADYLRRELDKVVHIARKSGLKAAFDEQISDPSSFQAGFHVSAYSNLRNFVLRLGGNVSASNGAFLINCHYDSAVESPGASDDFVSCAIMLEASRLFALGPNNLTNDLIFLFNGAEESILPSSHAFITQHPWAKDVVAFLNLEGAGSGGRLTMFQSGPGSDAEILLNTYSNSFSQPYGSVFAEELFQSGFVPSDTDFRIFRDFGHIPGLDMAYTSDGYCYHTKYDTESRISDACLQSTGQDIMAFLRRVAYDEKLKSIKKLESQADEKQSTHLVSRYLSSDDIDRSYRLTAQVKASIWSRRVYFDILGVQLISVPWKYWKLIDWLLVACLTCWLVYERRLSFARWCGFTFALLIQLCAQVLGILFAFVIGYLTHHYGCRMSWFSSRYNIMGVFLLPFVCWFFWFLTLLTGVPNGFLFGCRSSVPLFNKMEWLVSKKKNNVRIERDFFDAALFVIASHLLVFDILNSPATFVSTIWLAAALLGRFFYQMSTPDSLNNARWTLFIVFPVCMIWHFNFFATFIEFFIPVFGRSGQAIIPDIAMSLCLFYLISPLTLLFAGMVQSSSFSTAKSLRLVLLNACISYAVLVHASPHGFPYAIPTSSSIEDPNFSPRFQRVVLFHTERHFRDIADNEKVTSNDSYILLIPLDVNEVRFLRPNSYPVSIPSSVFSPFLSNTPSLTDDFGGLIELENASRVPCNRSRPYCGTPSLYPYIHFLQSFFHIPSTPHSLKPAAHLTMTSRVAWNNSLLPFDRRGVNLTFSVISGPPHTHLLIRTDTPQVRLSNWSFHSSSSFPIPVPLSVGEKSHSESTGAHYFIYHVNAEVLNESEKWTHPWNFWLCLDFAVDVPLPHVDLAVSGIYIHDSFTSCKSPQLSDVISRLPPWVSTMSGCSSYEHYRFSLI